MTIHALTRTATTVPAPTGTAGRPLVASADASATPRAAGDSLRVTAVSAAKPGLVAFAPAVSRADGALKASDGVAIQYRVTTPTTPVKAIAVMQMGTLSEKEAFDDMAGQLAARGIKSYAATSRAEAPTYKQHARDLDQLVAAVRRDNPGVPVTVMGVSLGAAIASDWNGRYNRNNTPVVAMAPVILPRFLKPKDLVRVSAGFASPKAAQKLVNSPMSVGAPLTTNARSLEADIPGAKTMFVKASLFDDVTKMGTEAAVLAHKSKAPIFIAMGAEDKVGVNPSTKAWAQSFRGSADLKVQVFPGVAHDMTQETNHPEWVKSLGDWILSSHTH